MNVEKLIQVKALTAEGKTPREIAALLDISVSYVKFLKREPDPPPPPVALKPNEKRWNELRGQDRKASEKYELKLPKDAVCTQERCVECKYPMWTRHPKEDTCEECLYRMTDELADLEVKQFQSHSQLHDPSVSRGQSGTIAFPAESSVLPSDLLPNVGPSNDILRR